MEQYNKLKMLKKRKFKVSKHPKVDINYYHIIYAVMQKWGNDELLVKMMVVEKR